MTTKKREEEIHKIVLYTDDAGKYVSVIFRDKEEKDLYIKQEGQFCKKALINLYRANTVAARREAKEALYEKRRSFARSKNFAPSKQRKDWWIYNPDFSKIRA